MRNSQPRPVHRMHFCSGSSNNNSSKNNHNCVGPLAAAESRLRKVSNLFGISLVHPTLADRADRTFEDVELVSVPTLGPDEINVESDWARSRPLGGGGADDIEGVKLQSNTSGSVFIDKDSFFI